MLSTFDSNPTTLLARFFPITEFNTALEDQGFSQSKSGDVRYWNGLKLEDSLEREFRYAQGI